MPEKPMTQDRKKREIAEKTVVYMLQLSKEYGFPLSRSNWHGLEIQIGFEMKQHFAAGDEEHLKQTAENTNVDLDAVAAALAAWRTKNDLMNITDVMERFNMLFGEVKAAEEQGYLSVEYPPSEAITAPKKYLPKHYEFNYPRAEVDALTEGHLHWMRLNGTIASSQAREFLEVDFKDARQFIVRLQPVGRVQGLRGNGMELFRISDLRALKEQLWRESPEYRAAVAQYYKSRNREAAVS